MGEAVAARLARAFTDRLTNGSMARAMLGLALTVVLCGAWAFSTGGYGGPTRPMLPVQVVPLIGWHVAGWPGLLVTSLAKFVPSSLLTLGD